MKITTNSFISIEAEEGYKLTTYKEGEDIKNSTYFSKGSFPLNYDTSVLREITIEEAEELEKQAQEAIEAELNSEE